MRNMIALSLVSVMTLATAASAREGMSPDTSRDMVGRQLELREYARPFPSHRPNHVHVTQQDRQQINRQWLPNTGRDGMARQGGMSEYAPSFPSHRPDHVHVSQQDRQQINLQWLPNASPAR